MYLGSRLFLPEMYGSLDSSVSRRRPLPLGKWHSPTPLFASTVPSWLHISRPKHNIVKELNKKIKGEDVICNFRNHVSEIVQNVLNVTTKTVH